MEVISAEQESATAGHVTRVCQLWLKALPNKICAKIRGIARMTRELGQDDPRRIIHSLKVGLALTLVSLFYYFKPLYDGFGDSAMWAVLTVVVVFEFSVGATLGKGFNRMLATFIAGALGVGAHSLATLSGRKGEPILVATFVFIIAAIVTFMRFFPKLKARYDYGLLIFILTFCLVSVSGYRDEQVLKIAHERASTIIVGSCISVLVCVCVCPVWVGEDLHNSVSANMEKLGIFLEAFGDEYFKESEAQSNENNKSFLQGYRSVLTSKSSEEMMTPEEIRGKFQVPCKMVSQECSKALKEVASMLRKMIKTKSSTLHTAASVKAAAEEFKNLMKPNIWEKTDLLEIIPAASVASLLLEIIECIEKIDEAVYELAKVASFRSRDSVVSPGRSDFLHQRAVQQVSDDNNTDHRVITVAE
ncbi:Aluminum-activated malate transporter [Corchorus capsularis]|uniref:Aluminum-activated malate transporter n=1 Tax=Corchorus capsularis TaxID=210143 RepID=A0A1R3JTL6_COCAP|nr:Aluminum-activated malate transporter [Corchorus capsularis]